MILAGDLGATRTRLAFFETEGNELQMRHKRDFMSREYSGLPEIVDQFIKEEGVPVERACIGVAGPVRSGRSKIMNLPWVIDAAELAHQLRLPSVSLINDMEAYAYGIEALAASDFAVLNEGVPYDANCAVVSAGSGLGEAGLYWDGYRHHPFATEGGHADFAPRNDLEIDMLRYLQAKFGRVSFERILSGPGLRNVYDFLRDTNRETEPSWLRDALRDAPDPSALISETALQGKAAICEHALSLFVNIYGAEAGNLALKFMAIGGVYLGGGIAPKILPKLRDQIFLNAFLDKGRLRAVLEPIPVMVVLSNTAGLLGAARRTLVRAAFGKGPEN